MDRKTLFLFGAAEKGVIGQPMSVASLDQLFDQLGHPPEQSEGIHYAVRVLLFQCSLIYFRVAEEGFSFSDYMTGLKWLKKTPLHSELLAICLPGVGDEEIIQATTAICHLHECLLIVSQKDLYDYLTAK